MKACKPKMVLALTGPRYDWVWDRMIDYLVWESVDTYPRDWLFRGHSESLGLSLARTYHPGYLQRDSAKWQLIGCAASQLRR